MNYPIFLFFPSIFSRFKVPLLELYNILGISSILLLNLQFILKLFHPFVEVLNAPPQKRFPYASILLLNYCVRTHIDISRGLNKDLATFLRSRVSQVITGCV